MLAIRSAWELFMSVVHSGANRFGVVVVGAGIVGAACAHECVRQGMSVAIVDGDAIGRGATSAAMGHIVVMDDSDAQFTLTRYSQKLWQELRPAPFLRMSSTNPGEPSG